MKIMIKNMEVGERESFIWIGHCKNMFISGLQKEVKEDKDSDKEGTIKEIWARKWGLHLSLIAYGRVGLERKAWSQEE